MALSLLLLAGAFSICAGGMAFLALSQPRNWRTVGVASPVWPHLRRAGWGLVLLSLAMTILREGPSFAALVWPMLCAAAAMLVGFTLAYRPQWLKPMATVFSQRSET